MKVLLLDDNALILEDLRSRLLDLGYEVATARDGKEAVTLLFPVNNSLDPTFNAIISDTNMLPGKSGLWLLQYLYRKGVTLPFLLHSGERYFYENGNKMDLLLVEAVFDFAEFHIKDVSTRYIERFLEKAV